MKKKLVSVFLFFALSAPGAFSGPVQALPKQQGAVLEPFDKEDRVLILAPHPDDETIGCAGIIQQALSAGACVRVVYLTNGDHNEFAFIVYEKRVILLKGGFISMGLLRHKEAIEAMKLLGLPENNLIFLGYPDFGTFTIFSRHWQGKKPYMSLLTRIRAVPYKENLSFGAPYTGESILEDLKEVLLRYRPNKIFVSHPADVNGDHKALYLFLEVALQDLVRQIQPPRVYPYLIHYVGWPLPRYYHPLLELAPPRQFLGSGIEWLRPDLTIEQSEKKHKATLCYKSQTYSAAFYLLSFSRRNELFGDYPEIELGKELPLEEQVRLFLGPLGIFFKAATDEGSVGDRGRVTYSIADNSLMVRIEKKEKLSRRFSVMLYLFGSSHKTPFARMPKICIITRHKSIRAFSAGKPIDPQGISVDLGRNTFILKVPLEILGYPDLILTSLRAYAGSLPASAIGFRRIEVK